MGSAGIGLDLAANFKPIQFRHHYIQQDQIGFERSDLVDGVLPVNCKFGLAINFDKQGFKQFPIGRVVVCDEYSRSLHGNGWNLKSQRPCQKQALGNGLSCV